LAAGALPLKKRFRKPPPNPKGNFVTWYGPGAMSAYLIKRRATIVLPLLLAIKRRLKITEKRRNGKAMALTSVVWKEAGDPSKNVRETMLDRLRQMPELVIFSPSHNWNFRYRVEKGPAWLAIEKAARRERNEKDEEGEEEIE
jgi:hypothetical protein